MSESSTRKPSGSLCGKENATRSLPVQPPSKRFSAGWWVRGPRAQNGRAGCVGRTELVAGGFTPGGPVWSLDPFRCQQQPLKVSEGIAGVWALTIPCPHPVPHLCPTSFRRFICFWLWFSGRMRKGRLEKRKTTFINFTNFTKVLLIPEKIASEKCCVCVPPSFYHTAKYALRTYGEYGIKLSTHLSSPKVPTVLRKMFKKEICAGGATKTISEQSQLLKLYFQIRNRRWSSHWVRNRKIEAEFLF